MRALGVATVGLHEYVSTDRLSPPIAYMYARQETENTLSNLLHITLPGYMSKGSVIAEHHCNKESFMNEDEICYKLLVILSQTN